MGVGVLQEGDEMTDAVGVGEGGAARGVVVAALADETEGFEETGLGDAVVVGEEVGD